MRKLSLLALLPMLFGTACGTPPTPPAMTTLTLSFENLVPIAPEDGHYEAWAIADRQAHSLGKFLMGSDGRPMSLEGASLDTWIVQASPQALTEIVVTQELPGDADSTPNPQEFLRGSFRAGQAALSAPLPKEAYAGESGSFLLDNPVTSDSTDFNGVWFSRVQAGAYVPGLSLGDAPDGWMYAGWVLYQGKALRMGRFHHRALNDDWAGYSGRSGATELINPAGSPQPGEDFITNLPYGISAITGPDLAGATVIVSLENATLTNAQHTYPSPVRIFTGSVPGTPARQVSYPLTNVVTSQVPSGLAAVK